MRSKTEFINNLNKLFKSFKLLQFYYYIVNFARFLFIFNLIFKITNIYIKHFHLWDFIPTKFVFSIR